MPEEAGCLHCDDLENVTHHSTRLDSELKSTSIIIVIMCTNTTQQLLKQSTLKERIYKTCLESKLTPRTNCLPVVTLVKCKSWKVRMNLGQDPRQGLILSFKVNCYHNCWLCICIRITDVGTSSTASSEFGIVWGCLIVTTWKKINDMLKYCWLYSKAINASFNKCHTKTDSKK